MSSYYSRIIIESYEDSFGIFIGDEDHMGVGEGYVISIVRGWLNNEKKRMRNENGNKNK